MESNPYQSPDQVAASASETAAPETPVARSWTPQIVLAIVALIWGGTFKVTQQGLHDCGPFWFLALRFGVGSALLAIILHFRTRWPNRFEWWAGTVLGGAVFAGYALQTVGLQTISTTKSAFITAIYVPLAPLMQALIMRERTRPAVWLGIVLCYVGLALISIDEHFSLSFGLGEWLTLGCSAAFAMQIAIIGRFAGETDPRQLGLTQLVVVAVLAAVGGVVMHDRPPHWTTPMLASVISLAVATALIAVAMNWAQRSVTPTRAAIIYATEPIWAAVVGAIAGESMPPWMLLGCGLILTGILVSELCSRGATTVANPAAPE